MRKYVEYQQSKQLAEKIKVRIESLNTTGSSVVVSSKGNLLLRLPQVSQISNGERDLLPKDYRDTFIEKHGASKFDYAEEYVEIPNDISLLRSVYNNGAHILENNKDSKEKMLYLKLNTRPLRQIIKTFLENYGNLIKNDLIE